MTEDLLDGQYFRGMNLTHEAMVERQAYFAVPSGSLRADSNFAISLSGLRKSPDNKSLDFIVCCWLNFALYLSFFVDLTQSWSLQFFS